MGKYIDVSSRFDRVSSFESNKFIKFSKYIRECFDNYDRQIIGTFHDITITFYDKDKFWDITRHKDYENIELSIIPDHCIGLIGSLKDYEVCKQKLVFNVDTPMCYVFYKDLINNDYKAYISLDSEYTELSKALSEKYISIDLRYEVKRKVQPLPAIAALINYLFK
jgi:hypothetical protein